MSEHAITARTLPQTIIASMPALMNVCTLWMLVNFIYAVRGRLSLHNYVSPVEAPAR